MARETSVTVREIDRRVLLVHVAFELGLITCVWSRIGQAARHFHSSERRHRSLLYFSLSNEVDDAEGLDREQVGEEVTRVKRPRGPFNKDTTTR